MTFLPGRLRGRSRRHVADGPSILDDIREAEKGREILAGFSDDEFYAEVVRQLPSFTPARDPLRDTGQMEALAAPSHEEFTDARQDADVLRRVRDGLRAMDTDEQAARRSDPAARRADFRADRRDLPGFRQTVQQVGWCGLHMERDWTWPWWTVERWYGQSMEAIDWQVRQARAEAGRRLGLVQAEVDAEFRAYQHPEGGRAA